MNVSRSRIGAIISCRLGAVVCGLIVTAQLLTQSAATPAITGPYRIAGVLVNSLTGEPVRRGLVEALNDKDEHAVASCVTDNDGRFALEHLAAAKYDLTASKRGFRTANYDEHEQFATAIVTGPDQDTAHLNFKLTPNSVLSGVVTDEAGEAVATARVMLFRRPKFAGIGEPVAQADTMMTDDTGAYEFGNLASGEYLLAVVAEPWYAMHEGTPSKRNPALDVVYPVTYFDSTSDEAAASPIVLAGGERQEANINLHAVPALRISIAVPRKADGYLARPELQQTIFGNVVSSQSAGFLDALETGTVEMGGIAPGHYQLTQGDPPRETDLDLSSSQQVDPNAGSPVNALSGTIRMLSGAPAPDEVTLSLQRADSSPGQKIYAAIARQGHFRFDGVPPGVWAVSATSGPEALPVVDVAVGGIRLAGSLITLRDRAPNLAVTISDFATDVHGVAKKDGKGFAGAMIVLLPKSPAQWRALTRRDQSDSDGSFALHDVSPGDYTLIAIAEGWGLDWTSPGAMARYLSGGTRVRVTESSGKIVQLGAAVAVQDR
jgi:hypothetical protein